jgi:tetratricopeptide (TPR) repeat protein
MQATPAGSPTGLLRALAERIDPQDPGAFNNLGVLYHTRGLHAEAVDAFLRALALDPRLRAAARNLEIAARQPGACDARLAAVEACIADNPHDRAARRERARLVRLLGRTHEAVHQLDALIAEDPDDADALFERGLIEQRAGDLRRAQRWFERAVNAGAVGHARLHLAEVLYQRGQNEQALAGLDALVHEFPDQADAHLLRGFVLGDMGHHESASDAARRAAQLNPALEALQGDLVIEATEAHHDAGAVGVMTVEADGALARHGLGLAFRQRGYFREARVEFERALAQGEDVRLVQHALAELDLLDGDSASARARYERLLGMEETARGWNEHGVALHQAGEVSGAAESYRRALRIDPRHALAYNNLGVALADRGETQAAREAFQRAAELDPSLVLARLNLARWYARHDDTVAALALLRELAEFHPREADVWHVLGRVLAQTARLEEARSALVKAIEARPAHAEARYALACVLEHLGDGDGAVRETQRALAAASVHREDRLMVGIALQRECPDAVGPVDLLSKVGGTPLVGVAIGDREVDALLPERPQDRPALPTVGERARRHCDAADDYGVRVLHGEAVERYRAARDLLETVLDTDADAAKASASSEEHTVWRALWMRAALGEARSACLLGREAGALPLLRRLMRQGNESADVLVLLAASLTAFDASAYRDEARSTLLRVLRRDVNSAALLHYAGDVSVRLRDEPLALGFYRRALAHDPTRPTPRVAIARLLRDRGDLLAARLELVAALAAAPGWPDAVVELARVHRGAGRLPDARTALVEHLMAIPTDLDALALLAEVLQAEGRRADARVAVDRVLRHDAEHPQAMWMDGVLLAEQSRLRDAVDRWGRLSRLNDAEPWSSRARAALARSPRSTVPTDSEAFDMFIFDEARVGPVRRASPPAVPVIAAFVA